MLKFGAAAALLLLPGPAWAQPPSGAPAPSSGRPTPPPEFIQAAQGFGECIGTSVGAAGSTVTPEAAAAQAVTDCARHKTALETAFDSWTASFPEAERGAAREQFRSRIANVHTNIAEEIRRRRAAAAAPAPSPAPRN